MTDAQSLPARQQWSAARGGPPADLSSIATPLFRKDEPVAFVGGKLAAALIGPLADAQFPAVQANQRHPALADIPPEEPEYDAFGHGYGEVHTAREFRQMVERAARSFAPEEDRWREGGRVIDPFRPGLRYAAVSDQEFDILQERHLNALRTTFRRAKTLVVALSHSEVWESRADGAVYPRWPSAAERHFDPQKHAVRTLTLEETVLDLAAAIRGLRSLNPALSIVLMVSPEPQLATIHPAHVLVAGSLGKSLLRVAMEVAAASEGVHYFPALEIACGIAPASAYADDGAIPPSVTGAIAEALVALGEGGAATYDGPAASVAVLRTVPSEPIADTAASQASRDAGAGKRKRKAKTAAVSVVDPYTTSGTASQDKPTLTVAERQAMRAEKLAAREARMTAAKANPPKPKTEAAEQPKRRKSPAIAASDLQTPESANAKPAKPKRPARKPAAKTDRASTGAGAETDAGSQPRRGKPRAAKR